MTCVCEGHGEFESECGCGVTRRKHRHRGLERSPRRAHHDHWDAIRPSRRSPIEREGHFVCLTSNLGGNPRLAQGRQRRLGDVRGFEWRGRAYHHLRVLPAVQSHVCTRCKLRTITRVLIKLATAQAASAGQKVAPASTRSAST